MPIRAKEYRMPPAVVNAALGREWDDCFHSNARLHPAAQKKSQTAWPPRRKRGCERRSDIGELDWQHTWEDWGSNFA